MKNILLLLVCIVLLSCTGTIDDNDLQKMNGYWEIEQVTMPDGSDKDYKVNPTVDYFELKHKAGFRKKVMPQFDGSYRVNNISEKISITNKGDITFINYTTPYAKWKEQIVEVDDDELVLKNDHGIEYRYKKAEPFTIK